MKDGLPGTRTHLRPFICTHCKRHKCDECIDVKRFRVAFYREQGRVCTCSHAASAKKTSPQQN